MGKSNAERQRDYRAARSTAGENGDRRLQSWVTTGTDLALDRLAKRYSLTRRLVLEKLILGADELESNNITDDAEFDKYLNSYTVTIKCLLATSLHRVLLQWPKGILPEGCRRRFRRWFGTPHHPIRRTTISLR